MGLNTHVSAQSKSLKTNTFLNKILPNKTHSKPEGGGATLPLHTATALQHTQYQTRTSDAVRSPDATHTGHRTRRRRRRPSKHVRKALW